MATSIALLGVLSVAGRANAQAACDTPDHRAFDFWIGTWDVHTAEGKLAGRNVISKVQGGCALREAYSTARGYAGESLNAYDRDRGTWHQTWVDTGGLVLQLEGGMEDGSMVMAGETVDAEGKATRQRITWTPNADGSVRQLWESADVDGEWSVVFDGRYTRAAEDTRTGGD
ncbi:hypothetical protein GCM10028862_21160 [Luteimonas pelagia]